MTPMDRVVFGDNQFFGINHMSEQKAAEQEIRFRDNDAVIRVIDTAWDVGVRAFMFNTHDRVSGLCDHFRAHPDRYAGLRLYPSMPYPHKYANAVSEKGVMGALKFFTAGSLLEAITSGGIALFTRDAHRLMRILVDAEMRTFRDLDVRVVFLQNIVTDLLLGMGMTDLFAAYADHIRSKHGVEPGFITMNLPECVRVLHEAGIDNPVVCSSINQIGYLMNPSREACEARLRARGFRPMAMSILASGAVPPSRAVDYVASQPGIESVVFGASSQAHIQQTKHLIEQAFG